MGSSSSKVVGKAAAAAAGKRQYPSSSSILNSAKSTSNSPSTTTGSRQTAQPGAAAEGMPSSGYSSAQVRPSPTEAPPSSYRSPQIDLDGRDPQFGSALRDLMNRPNTGTSTQPSQPRSNPPPSTTFPTSSHPPAGQVPGLGKNVFPSSSPSTNPQLVIVQARHKVGERYEQENQNIGRGTRTLISAKDIRDALKMRDEAGRDIKDVEKQFRLRPGVLDQLATKGVFANT